MKNLTKEARVSPSIWSVPHLVAFEVTIAIISTMVIVTSFWVIKFIYSKETRSRTDFLFATASISDIGVGLLSLPLGGLLAACTCTTFVKCSILSYCLIGASNLFPHFSYLTTTVIAIDRLLLTTQHYNYKTFVTRGRLKITVGLAFFLSAGYNLLAVYYGIYLQRSLPFTIVNISVGVILPFIIVVAYICILCYVYRRSNTMSHCKASGRTTKKKITKTIMLILISQSILTLPFTFLSLSITTKSFNDFVSGNLKLHLTLFHWFFLLWNCQFFVNGMIFLVNQRKRIQPKKEHTRETKIESEAGV